MKTLSVEIGKANVAIITYPSDDEMEQLKGIQKTQQLFDEGWKCFEPLQLSCDGIFRIVLVRLETLN